MDAKFSEEQEMLRESARSVLEQECPMALVRAQFDDTRGLPEALWQRMAELGWLGMIVPERYGGSELGMLDIALSPALEVPDAVIEVSVAGRVAIRDSVSLTPARTLHQSYAVRQGTAPIELSIAVRQGALQLLWWSMDTTP
ncbi:MAG: acyl-CoA dehydrogenase family protein [Gemmatimonadetes bacterium]|nr:acyl-CoA dehydrogenase family protein [Gemmatimonadota bacterium]